MNLAKPDLTRSLIGRSLDDCSRNTQLLGVQLLRRGLCRVDVNGKGRRRPLLRHSAEVIIRNIVSKRLIEDVLGHYFHTLL